MAMETPVSAKFSSLQGTFRDLHEVIHSVHVVARTWRLFPEVFQQSLHGIRTMGFNGFFRIECDGKLIEMGMPYWKHGIKLPSWFHTGKDTRFPFLLQDTLNSRELPRFVICVWQTHGSGCWTIMNHQHWRTLVADKPKSCSQEDQLRLHHLAQISSTCAINREMLRDT